MDLLLSDSRSRRDDLIREFRKASGGSFSIIYKALRDVSTASGSTSSLDRDAVIKRIEEIKKEREEDIER